MTDLINTSDESPFEALRHVDSEGEHWLARELWAPLGYANWDNFTPAVDRAKLSAQANGDDVAYHFRDRTSDAGRWGNQEVDDVRLTKRAAHLVAMNGDVRKPEIAGAQAYFSDRADREMAAPLDEIEVAERYLAKLKEAKAAKEALVLAEAQRDEARAEVQLFQADPELLSIGQCANTLGIGRTTFYQMLREAGIVFEDTQKSGHRIYQHYLQRGWGEARWEKWANGAGWSWTPYFTRVGLAGVRKALGSVEKGLSS